MAVNRIIPVLLLKNKQLVKTVRFKGPVHIGDPINTVRILNDKNIPELLVLDIAATLHNREPDYNLISAIAGECSIPLIYGGGISTTDNAKKVFDCGVEKISLNSSAFFNPCIISEVAKIYGSQSVMVSMDVKQTSPGLYRVFTKNGSHNTGIGPKEYANQAAQNGCGEILLNSIDRDGTREGYDTDLIEQVSSNVNIPVIACGGAGCTEDLTIALKHGASAAAAGSLFFFNGKHRAVLISFPSYLT